MLSSMSQRVNFSGAEHTPNYPDFLDIQIKSFQDFFQLETKSDERNEEGLFNTFKENFPISEVCKIIMVVVVAAAVGMVTGEVGSRLFVANGSQ